MRLWAALYAFIWVLLVEALLAMSPFGGWVIDWMHFALGLVVIGIAYSNFSQLRATTAPGRIKRVARAAVQMSVAGAVFGLPVALGIGTGWTLLFGITVANFLILLHVIVAVALLTQTAAVAIAYDMWEEKEFASSTRPGEIPELVVPPGFRPPTSG